MRWLPVGFKNKTSAGWYDLSEDWELIESSLAKQYGIRIRQNTDMPWAEFCSLVSGLMADTPLGNIVAIRSETNPETIKNFNSSQRKIHRDWRVRQANSMSEEDLEKQMRDLERALSVAFGKGV